MTNYEKYRDEIMELNTNEDVLKFYNDIGCYNEIHATSGRAEILKTICWMMSEYKEPEVNWSKVEVDTPILVSGDNKSWRKRHFAKYENDMVYAWDSGTTSWSAEEDLYDDKLISWSYAKLARGNNNGK